MMQEKRALTDYEIIPELANRWSPRAFADKPVEDEKLLQLLEAARWAASSNNEQPWRFFIGKKSESESENFGERESEGERGETQENENKKAQESTYEKLHEGLNKWNKKWTWTAPVLCVTIAKKTFTKNDDVNKHAWHDVGLAMGNLSAQATSMGLYLHQMAGIEADYLYEALQIPKAEYEIVSMFALGYQDETRLEALDERYHEPEKSMRSRKALTEIVFDNQFGLTPEWIPTKK